MSEVIEVKNGAEPPALIQVPINNVAFTFDWSAGNVQAIGFTYPPSGEDSYTYKKTFYYGTSIASVAVDGPGQFRTFEGLTASIGRGATFEGKAEVSQYATITTPTGSGYTLNDILTAVGGTFDAPATLNVDSVDGDGAITSVSIIDPGTYTEVDAQISTYTGGTGTDASILLYFGLASVTVTDSGNGYTDESVVTVIGDVLTQPNTTITLDAIPDPAEVTSVTAWLVQP